MKFYVYESNMSYDNENELDPYFAVFPIMSDSNEYNEKYDIVANLSKVKIDNKEKVVCDVRKFAPNEFKSKEIYCNIFDCKNIKSEELWDTLKEELTKLFKNKGYEIEFK